MNCNKKVILGLILSIVCLVFVVFSFAFPWFFVSRNYIVEDGDNCRVLELVGWNLAYCEKGSACDDLFPGAQNRCPEGKSWDWRDKTDSPKTETVYDVVGSLIAVTTFCLVLSLLAFVMVLCGIGDHALGRIIHAIVIIIGLAALIICIIYFPLAISKSLEEDNLFCVASGAQETNTTGPCDKFMGTETLTWNNSGTESDLDLSWGGAGWFVSIFACVPIVISIVLALLARDDD